MTKIHTGTGGRGRGVPRPSHPAGHRARDRAGFDSPVGATIRQGGAGPCRPAHRNPDGPDRANHPDPYASRQRTCYSSDSALLGSAPDE